MRTTFRLVRFAVLLTLFVSVWGSVAYSQKSNSGIRLGFVEKFSPGAGDRLWLANTNKENRVDRKALAVLLFHGSGWINVNGNNIDISLVSHRLGEKNLKVGRGGYQVWKGKGIKIRLDYVFTWRCPPGRENCSVYHFRGLLDINFRGKRGTS